jgi:hypothetical protein
VVCCCPPCARAEVAETTNAHAIKLTIGFMA